MSDVFHAFHLFFMSFSIHYFVPTKLDVKHHFYICSTHLINEFEIANFYIQNFSLDFRLLILLLLLILPVYDYTIEIECYLLITCTCNVHLSSII